MTYTVTDGTDTYPLAELEISYTGTELDEAQFVIAGAFDLNTAITIYSDSTAQFIGYIKNIEELEQGALYKYTAYEKAVELKTMPYLSSSSDIFSKSSITIANLATDILTSTPDSGWDLASGMADTTTVSMNFYMVNRLQAINKVLREMRGYYVIFDSNANTVKFLDSTGINTDRSASNMVYQTKTLISSSMLRGITQVVVIGKDSSIRGEYGSSTSSRAYYQVDDITSNDEALKIATAIYGDIGVAYEDYKVTVSPDEIQYDVRDKVKVDGSYFWIKSIIQGMDGIELVLDDGRTSVIESFGSRIHIIEGDFPSGSDASWSGGNTNVAANSASYTEFTFDVKDKNVISNAVLDLTIGSFIKSANVNTTTGILSDISMTTTTASVGDEAMGAYNICIPDTYGVTSGVMASGFQFGICSFSVQIATQYATTLYFDLEKSYNGGSWTRVGLCTAGTPDNGFQQISLSFLFSGSTDSESSGGARTNYRLYVYPDSGLIKSLHNYVSISRCPRHAHTVTTTYDKTTTGTPPSYLNVTINSTSIGSVTPGTTKPDITSYLTNGKNIIKIATPSGANNQCSVNPTITYQTLGKS